MDIVLWIIAVTLAAAFGAAGVMKLAQPKPKLAASGMAWVNDFSPGAIRASSSLEVCWRRSAWYCRPCSTSRPS